VPFENAHDMSPWERLAYLVVFGELEGVSEWDWGAMTWVEKQR